MSKERRYGKSNPAPKLTEPQRELAEKYIPFARKLSKPFRLMFPRWHEDFDSAALMALTESARDFDPTKGVKFCTFAAFRIRGELKNVGRSMRIRGFEKEDHQPHLVSLFRNWEQYGKLINAQEPEPVGAETDDMDSFEALIGRVPPMLQHVCRRYFLHGETFLQIAEESGVCQTAVFKRMRLAIRLMAPAFDDNGHEIARAIKKRRTKLIA